MFKIMNILIKRCFIRCYSNIISKRYISTESNDVFKAQDRGYFHDNIADMEYVFDLRQKKIL